MQFISGKQRISRVETYFMFPPWAMLFDTFPKLECVTVFSSLRCMVGYHEERAGGKVSLAQAPWALDIRV